MPHPSRSIPDFSNTTIGNKRYKCLEKIGSGAFGAVYRAVECKAAAAGDINPTQYAVKILSKFLHDPEDPTSLPQESLLLAQQEREIWIHKAMSSCEGVVALHESFDEGAFRFLVLDYCDGPNLYERFSAQPYWRKDDAIKDLFLQVLRTVQQIHSKGVYHRDIKPENILCSSDGRVFLSDFGLSTMNKHSASFRCGSISYMSPECFGEDFDADATEYSTPSSDIWSLGVVLLNLLVSEQAWNLPSVRDPEFRDYAEEPQFLRVMFPISKSANKLLRSMMNTIPSSRIKIADVITEVQKIKTFFMTDAELDGKHGTLHNRRVAKKLGGRRKSTILQPIPRKPHSPPRLPDIDISSLAIGTIKGTHDSMLSREAFMLQLADFDMFGPPHKATEEVPHQQESPNSPVQREERPTAGQFIIGSLSSGPDSVGPITPETYPVEPKISIDSIPPLRNPYDDVNMEEFDIGDMFVNKMDVFDVKKILNTPPKREMTPRLVHHPPIPEDPPKKRKWYVKDFRNLARKGSKVAENIDWFHL